ncbi:MAG: type II secretion system protein [Planctomycetota bacterium]|jgi:prepilin-type N-terminal cleavage/methylation domain-containing protein
MSKNRGFTMIELLTVISIIALLMAVYGGINANTDRSKKPGKRCYV